MVRFNFDIKGTIAAVCATATWAIALQQFPSWWLAIGSILVLCGLLAIASANDS